MGSYAPAGTSTSKMGSVELELCRMNVPSKPGRPLHLLGLNATSIMKVCLVNNRASHPTASAPAAKMEACISPFWLVLCCWGILGLRPALRKSFD